MFESPRSLQEVCVDFICDNVLALCEVHSSNIGSTNFNQLSTTTTEGKKKKKMCQKQIKQVFSF